MSTKPTPMVLASRSATSGETPLYGTCGMTSPYSALMPSITRWPVEPLPHEP